MPRPSSAASSPSRVCSTTRATICATPSSTSAGVQHYTGDDLREAVEYLRGAWGRHPFEDLVDPVLPLAAADEALALAAAGGAFRVGVDPRR